VYPEIAHWGILHIRSYGVMLAIAFLVGTWLGLKEARRYGMDEDRFLTVILFTLVGSIFGARILYVMEHIVDYRGQWSSALALWQGGLTLYGGIIAGTIVGLWMAKRQGLSPWRVADALAPSLAIGTAFGRVGCFLNGCCYGRPTHLPWGVVYPPDTFPGLEFGATPIHPSQLYFSLASLALFAVVWAVRKRAVVPGTLFLGMISAYALIRIPLDFTRAYEPGTVVAHLGSLDITESQLVSVTLALVALLVMMRLHRAAAESAAPAAAPAAPGAPPAVPPASPAQP
jgi:phosphatidylglycerol:prolipoprotein diacylglycerol transferase